MRVAISHTLKKHKRLRATHKALVSFAKKLNYKVLSVPGSSGGHASDGVKVFEIHVGRNQSLEDKVITLAHEIGHALDYAHSPIGIAEKARRLLGTVDLLAVSREVAAWGYGRELLVDMDCYRFVIDRFHEMRNYGLSTYNSALEKKDKPNENYSRY